jgi:hypothetical protein
MRRTDAGEGTEPDAGHDSWPDPGSEAGRLRHRRAATHQRAATHRRAATLGRATTLGSGSGTGPDDLGAVARATTEAHLSRPTG